MKNSLRLSSRMMIGAIAILLLAANTRAGDDSFSSVVKHIQSNYKAQRQGTFGAISFARFLIKVIRPAGVKNFKIVMLKKLEYDGQPSPESPEFHSFIRSRIHTSWQPLVQYSARREKQWTYVYVTNENRDVKLLVVTIQKQDAFVVQVKFSPDKLIAFMNDPRIMGIRLNDDADKEKNPTPADASEKKDETSVKKAEGERPPDLK